MRKLAPVSSVREDSAKATFWRRSTMETLVIAIVWGLSSGISNAEPLEVKDEVMALYRIGTVGLFCKRNLPRFEEAKTAAILERSKSEVLQELFDGYEKEELDGVFGETSALERAELAELTVSLAYRRVSSDTYWEECCAFAYSKLPDYFNSMDELENSPSGLYTLNESGIVDWLYSVTQKESGKFDWVNFERSICARAEKAYGTDFSSKHLYWP